MPALRRWGRTLLVIALVFLELFAIAGYLTAGSLQAPGYQTAAWIYLGLLGASTVALVGLLVHGRIRRDKSRPVI